MNVLIAVPWDQETGGVAFVVGHLASHLRDQGHGVLFLHPSARRWPRRKVTRWGFPGYEVNLRSPNSPPSLRARIAHTVTYPVTFLALLWILRRHRIDLVNVHYPSAMFGYFGSLRRQIRRLRLVVSVHGTDLTGPSPDGAAVDGVTGRLLDSADAVVSPSRGFARQCHAVLGKLASRLHVIHNGVTLSEFGGTPGIRATGTVLTVASLDPWKGLDVLIRAFAGLLREERGLRLLIAGSGPEREALESLVQELGLQGGVEFLGQVDRTALKTLLATCTVFALPSRSEPFGIVVAEALAAGAPTVATEVGGIPEILDAGAYGLLVPPDDVAALQAALGRLLRDDGLRRALSASGPPRAAAEFQWEFTGQRYLDLFQNLLGSPRCAASQPSSA